MRQGQQNRRGRGRNNNNGSNNNNSGRKSQNPVTRSYESTGPDVKIRGTPSHVAEKYISLARDALSSGDPVLAENYLQHAEHYNRIIMTYREQQMSQGGEFAGNLPRPHTLGGQDGTDGDEFGEDDGDEFNGNAQPGSQSDAMPGQSLGQGQPMPFAQSASQPQRNYDNPQRYDNRLQRQDSRNDNRQNNNFRGDRDGNRYDRNDRGDRQQHRSDNRPDYRQDNRGDNRNDNRQDRNTGEPRGFRDDRGPQPAFGADDQGGDAQQNRPRRERFQNHNGSGNGLGGGPNGNADRQPPAPAGFVPQPPIPAQALPPLAAPVQAAAPPPAMPIEAEQPAFLRRPVRRPRRDDTAAPAAPRQPVADDQE